MARPRSPILELAKRGAEVRLRELLDELKLLTVSFPHLRDSFDPDELPTDFILRKGEASSRVARRRIARRWTHAQRRAAAARMKAFWAKRKP